MNTNYYDMLLKEFESGTSPEDLAQALTSALNKAKDEYDKRKVKEAKQAEKEALAREIAEKVFTYVKKYHPEAGKLLDQADITDEDIKDMVREIDSSISHLGSFLVATPVVKDADKTIKDFIAKLL